MTSGVRPKREGIQLAYPVDDGKIKRLGDNIIVQPKLNGERCRVAWYDDEPVLLSSYGNVMPWLGQIKEDLLELKARTGIELPLDGEIYKHGWPRERIASALRTKIFYKSDNGELEYHVFDMQVKLPQFERIAKVGQIVKDLVATKFVYSTIVPVRDWKEFAKAFVDEGYEGIILRDLNSTYVTKRTVSMLKFKPTQEDTYRILDVIEALSEDGDPKGMVGAFLVTDGMGGQFKVGAGKMDHAERELLWQERQYIPGKMLLVKHEKIKTSGGVPLCSVAVEVM